MGNGFRPPPNTWWKPYRLAFPILPPGSPAAALFIIFVLEDVSAKIEEMGKEEEEEAEIERLPVDILACIFSFLPSFIELAQASSVCRKWRRGVEQSLAQKERLSLSGFNVDDEILARIVHSAYGLKELDISRSCWRCKITDEGLFMISLAKCIGNLTYISMWGMARITDRGVIPLVSEATSLRHLNVGGTFITDESLFAIANSCPHLKAIVLWCCRHVTATGLILLVNKCRELESINVWGMRLPGNFVLELHSISPALQINHNISTQIP
ncbi:hypothetical protein J5N97_026621 [Dioscorea zingiberensis]|uniref:F-box domain-containing protein n=1 Tax=Dioscorea zingiberensis TaxID=325984 RepID=A0A9D5C3A5_9LILI|nr:hypothetical protein J5N97_026621 [Dioscorea zingiberensis]